MDGLLEKAGNVTPAAKLTGPSGSLDQRELGKKAFTARRLERTGASLPLVHLEWGQVFLLSSFRGECWRAASPWKRGLWAAGSQETLRGMKTVLKTKLQDEKMRTWQRTRGGGEHP